MEEFEVEELTLEDLIFEPPFVDVIIKGKPRKFWLRPPSETEKSMAQNAARSQSRALRNILENTKSEQYKFLVLARTEELGDDELRMLWLTQTLFTKLFEMNRISLDNREEYFEPSPEGKADGVIPPTLEEVDQWENRKEKATKKRLSILRKQQEQVSQALQVTVKEKTREELIQTVIPFLIDEHCTVEWNAEYGMRLVTWCTYRDKELEKPAFKNIAQVKKLMITPEGGALAKALVAEHLKMMVDSDKLRD